MSQNVTVFRIMIAAPDDVAVECEKIREVIQEWNDKNSVSKNIVLLPLYWKYNTSLGVAENSVQEMIEKQLIPNSDLIISIFWSTLGTKDTNGEFRTINEINKHIKQDKQAAIFFKDPPKAKSSEEIAKIKDVLEFKENIDKRLVKEPFYKTFESISYFEQKIHGWFEAFIQEHILSKLNRFANGASFDNVAHPRSQLLQTKVNSAKKSLFISGLSLISTTISDFSYCIDNNIKIRFLLPECAPEIIKLNSMVTDVSQDILQGHIVTALKHLKESEAFPRDMEVRSIGFVMSIGLVGIDIEEPYGQIQVQQYLYNTAPSLAPTYTCYSGEKWFDIYKKQIEKIWEAGKEI